MLLAFLVALSTAVFVPIAGQTRVVDTLRVDVLDVRATQWQPPPGVSVLHYALVRATDRGETRTLTLVASTDRIEVMNDHALRLLEQPLRVSIEPAPAVLVDARYATRLARARVTQLGWATSPVSSSSILVRGTSWEVSFQLASDLDAFVRIDAATGRILEASKRGGP